METTVVEVQQIYSWFSDVLHLLLSAFWPCLGVFGLLLTRCKIVFLLITLSSIHTLVIQALWFSLRFENTFVTKLFRESTFHVISGVIGTISSIGLLLGFTLITLKLIKLTSNKAVDAIP